MVYIDEATFENIYTHRDASVSPGSTQFTQWIKTYSTQINNYLQVSSDICAVADASHVSETIIGVIGVLLENHYDYIDLWRRTPEPERATLPVPHIRDRQFLGLLFDLDSLKGQDSSIEEPAFNFILSRTEGGFE